MISGKFSPVHASPVPGTRRATKVVSAKTYRPIDFGNEKTQYLIAYLLLNRKRQFSLLVLNTTCPYKTTIKQTKRFLKYLQARVLKSTANKPYRGRINEFSLFLLLTGDNIFVSYTRSPIGVLVVLRGEQTYLFIFYLPSASSENRQWLDYYVGIYPTIYVILCRHFNYLHKKREYEIFIYYHITVKNARVNFVTVMTGKKKNYITLFRYSLPTGTYILYSH